MGEILTEAKQFKPEEVQKEVAALVEARVALFKKAGDDMGALKDSEDFGAVRDAVAKFSKWEASEIATALQALEQQRDSMVDAAKSEPNDLGSSQDLLARPATQDAFARPLCASLALLMPQVNPGPLYRCGDGT